MGAGSRANSERRVLALLVALPVLKLLVHVLVGGGYGYHRDELYYLACADRLDWGYVDHPPLSILVLRAATAVLGDSVRAIRMVPAAAGTLTVLVVGLLARRLGGGPYALALAMAVALAAPVYLALDQYFSMNALDILLWATSAYLLVLVLRGAPPQLWLVLGLTLGLGLENKLSVLWLLFGLAVGLLATPERRVLRTPWPWLAAAIAVALLLPHVLWQVHHGWPTAEFVHHATSHKMVRTAISVFARGQVEGMLMSAAPVWLAGLAFFLLLPAGRGLRALGWAYVAIFAFLALGRSSRVWYLAPAYTWLLAAGGVAIEGALASVRSWARLSLLGLILAHGLYISPVVLPLLAQPAAATYSRIAGARRVEERTGIGALPEFFGHMSGWNEIVGTVAAAFERLPEGERAGAAILAPNYGVAAAIDRLGRGRGLPPALSGHNNYWLWGPRGYTGAPTIVVGRSEAELHRWFGEVTRVGWTDCGYCMPYENHQPVWVAGKPRAALAELWPELKFFE